MRWITVIWLVLSLSACKDARKLIQTDSIGRPYEVLVVCDDSMQTNRVRSVLETPVEGLPQQEPAFDVSTTSWTLFKGPISRTRNLVLVEITGKGATSTIRIGKDVYASPQTVIYITTPTAKQLEADLAAMGKAIRLLLQKNECRNAIGRLKEKHNPKAEKLIKEMFGVDMLIPADMTSWKTGQDFLWLSNNSPTAMQNICLYLYNNRTPVHQNKQRWTEVRDSVMKANIHGEQPGMHMTTAQAELTTYPLLNDTTYCLRGLWEMTGDMMGGPFVSISCGLSNPTESIGSGKQVVAEAFVFAPSQKKRNLVRQLEAVLQTLSSRN